MTSTTNNPSATDTVKIHLGIPPFASVEIPVKQGFWSRRRRWLRPRWEELVVVLATGVQVYAPQDDEGYLVLHLHVANLGPSPIGVERFEFTGLLIGNAGITLTDSALLNDGALPGWSDKTIRISATFGATGIKTLQRLLRVREPGLCTPRAAVAGQGRVDLSSGSKRLSRPVFLSDITPFINLYNPSSQEERPPSRDPSPQ